MPGEPTDKDRLISTIENEVSCADYACSRALAAHHTQRASWLKQLLRLKYPEPLPREGNVASLEDHRIRVGQEFEHDLVAYLEVTWGKETFAFNAAVRNLERMRRGTDDGTLRPPETSWEAEHMVFHVRALANDLARFWGQEHLVREEDDRAEEVLDQNGEEVLDGEPE